MADVTGTLKRIIDAAGTQKEDKGVAKNWWRWPLVILLVLVAVAVFAWISRRDARELAKLRHEKKVREVERAQADLDAKIATETVTIDQHQKRIDESDVRVRELSVQIKKVEARLAVDKEAIDRIRTWDDVGSEPPG